MHIGCSVVEPIGRTGSVGASVYLPQKFCAGSYRLPASHFDGGGWALTGVKSIDLTFQSSFQMSVLALRARNWSQKLIMGGLWADLCLAYPAIQAMNLRHEALVPENTVGSITQLSNDNGMKRMQAAGVKPITWTVVLAELQRNYARSGT